MKNNIRLIGTDLDGTLLNDQKQLSPATREALREAALRGIHLVPITGRPLTGIPACVRELPEIEYIVSANGACVYDVKNAKALFSFAIDAKKSRALIDGLRGIDCLFEPFADGVGYSEERVFLYYLQTFKNTPLEDYFFSSRKICERYEALFDGTTRCADEIFVNCADPAVRRQVIALSETVGGLQYCNLGDRFIEITKKGTDKGAALRAVCDYLGVDIADTLAFGDGENDVEFMQAAGIAVAVENAFPVIKNAADYITLSNNEDGVAHFLRRLFDD